MNAIYGIFHKTDKPVSPQTLEAMERSFVHRPPGSGQYWHKGGTGLGQRSCPTTPKESRETFPLTDTGNRLVLVADARLDNREELMQSLGLAANARDGELVLGAYQKWGEESPRHLAGDYAFAIWDSETRKLFCTRDCFGVRPFYYFDCGEFFAFASEIRALHALKGVERRLNETAVGDYLIGSWEDPEITFFRGIRRLAASRSMTVSQKSVSLKRYRSPGLFATLKPKSDAEYAEMYRDIFSAAVRSRVRSLSPVGVSLSGGLDSSSIACVARAHLGGGGSIHTFSLVFNKLAQCDERPFIEAVTCLGSIVPHAIVGEEVPIFANLERILDIAEEPFGAANFDLYFNGIYPEARRLGVGVLLDGEGGDGTSGHGWTRLTELFLEGRLVECARLLRVAGAHLNQPIAQILWQRCLRPMAPAGLNRLWHRARWGGRYPSMPRYPVVRHEFADRIGLDERAHAHFKYELSLPKCVRDEELTEYASPMNQRWFEMDKVASAFGIELRYPFYDRRLYEFYLSLPSSQKLDRQWPRAVMRRALKGVLPEEVRRRRGKIVHMDCLTHRLAGRERAAAQSLLFDTNGYCGEFVDHGHVKRLWENFISEPDSEKAIILWRTAILSLWLKINKLG